VSAELKALLTAFEALERGPQREKPVDYPCYACGEESTHEIRHRGGWLDVCDECDLEGKS